MSSDIHQTDLQCEIYYYITILNKTYISNLHIKNQKLILDNWFFKISFSDANWAVIIKIVYTRATYMHSHSLDIHWLGNTIIRTSVHKKIQVVMSMSRSDWIRRFPRVAGTVWGTWWGWWPRTHTSGTQCSCGSSPISCPH